MAFFLLEYLWTRYAAQILICIKALNILSLKSNTLNIEFDLDMENTTDSAAALPRHIAIIPDGNRRWARQHALQAWLGHQKGSEILENLLDVLIDSGIPHFSFWGSSQDNLAKRPKEEVSFLLKLFKEQFSRLEKDERIHKNEIKINIFGAWREQFPPDVKAALENAIEKTKDYDKFFFNFFIAYSGTGEMLDAVRRLAEMRAQDSALDINAGALKSQLLTKDLPPVDLLIRTGGEPHNSDGFMMWDVADSQFFFSDKLWPDFTDKDLKTAIKDYTDRERRMGK